MFYRPARPVASARPGKIRRLSAFVSPRSERSEASAFPAPTLAMTLCFRAGRFMRPHRVVLCAPGAFCITPDGQGAHLSASFLVRDLSNLLSFIFLPRPKSTKLIADVGTA